MRIKRIIMATGNEGKVVELRKILADVDVPVFTIKELGIKSNPNENGTTFKENALIKARAITPKDGDAVISDDSGLIVDYMNGRPGVHSARYLGDDNDYDKKMNGILEELADAGDDERTARFETVVAMILSDGREFTTHGVMKGHITREKRGTNGFGYDPIFLIDEYNKTGGEVSREEKNAVSHRGKALRAMREIIVNNL